MGLEDWRVKHRLEEMESATNKQGALGDLWHEFECKLGRCSNVLYDGDVSRLVGLVRRC